MYVSAGLTPAALMRTNTWPGPGVGVGISSSCMTSGAPNWRTTMAFMESSQREREEFNPQCTRGQRVSLWRLGNANNEKLFAAGNVGIRREPQKNGFQANRSLFCSAQEFRDALCFGAHPAGIHVGDHFQADVGGATN